LLSRIHRDCAGLEAGVQNPYDLFAPVRTEAGRYSEAEINALFDQVVYAARDKA
jgi:hypothetical protein